MKCYTGYEKSGNGCISIKKITIPENSYASSSNSQGWKCKSGYNEIFNIYCLNLLPIPIARTYGVGFYCNPGYRKSTVQNACVKK